VAYDFKELFIRYKYTFAKSSTDIGLCDLLEHDIDTGMLLQSGNHLETPHLCKKQLKMT